MTYIHSYLNVHKQLSCWAIQLITYIYYNVYNIPVNRKSNWLSHLQQLESASPPEGSLCRHQLWFPNTQCSGVKSAGICEGDEVHTSLKALKHLKRTEEWNARTGRTRWLGPSADTQWCISPADRSHSAAAKQCQWVIA